VIAGEILAQFPVHVCITIWEILEILLAAFLHGIAANSSLKI
jgi:hypothetical protein